MPSMAWRLRAALSTSASSPRNNLAIPMLCLETRPAAILGYKKDGSMNRVEQVAKVNERELELGIAGTSASWHEKYRESAWVYVGGLSSELSEGDVICVLSQFGEVEDLNMPRERKTGKPRGWCWCKYDDQRSTILAVDNLNGVKLLGRTLRVDHCERYKLPVELREAEGEEKYAPGAIYADKELASKYTLRDGVDVWGAPEGDREPESVPGHKSRRNKSMKKKKKKRKLEEEKEDEGLLPYDFDQPLPPPRQDVELDAVRPRQGEVLAPNWRGRRDPAQVLGDVPRPAVSSREEREMARNKSYGGMFRRR